MYHSRYILDERGEPVPEPDLFTWAAWIEERREQRIVRQEWVGEWQVSTVFLGLDHRWGEGPPILWETMVFQGPHNGTTTRCAGGREQAEAMHDDMMERMQAMAALNAPSPPTTAEQ